jgi:hypothetical protein
VSDPVQRVNYFDHQFLHVDDFQTEQTYHIDARRRHNQYLHTPGVAYGLRVASAGASSTAVTIGEGMALDANGNEIVVADVQTLELGTFPADHALWIVVSYDEQTGRQTTETGVAGDTRVTEQPSIQAIDQASQPTGAGRIVLAQVARTGTTVSGVDESPRSLAGSLEGDVNLTPRNPATPQSQWVTMSWAAPNRADLLGTLHVRKPAGTTEGNLQVDGGVQAAGPLMAPAGTITGNFSVGGPATTGPLTVRAGGLQFADPAGPAYTGGWVGMANNIEGTKRWLHVGGIIDQGGDNVRRLALYADRVFVPGSLGLGVVAPVPQIRIDSAGPAFFRSAPGVGGLAQAAGSSGLALGFDQQAGNGFIASMAANGAPTRLWLDGDPIFFASGGTERARVDSGGNFGVSGGLLVDGIAANTGAFPNTVPAPLLTFGQQLSGEGIGSKRNAGGNQFGLDFYTDFTPRLSITNGGGVGIGTQAPEAALHVNGDIRWANSIIGSDQGGSIELGGRTGMPGAGGTPYIDFHFGSAAQDFNARIVNDADGQLSVTNPPNTQSITFRQNMLCVSGGVGGSSISYNARRDPANNWAFLDSQRPGVTLEMDDTPGYARFEVWTQTIARSIINTAGPGGIIIPHPGPPVISGWQRRMSINGNTGETTFDGKVNFNGGKQGYVVDQFVNNLEDALEQGDVVVFASSAPSLYYGNENQIPIPEADLTSQAYDNRVCGIVDTAHGVVAEAARSGRRRKTPTLEARAFDGTEEDVDRTRVEPGQVGAFVTLGAYAYCKVDADIAPIKVGDLLTTSPTPGHAQKVLDREQAAGAIIGKAMASRTRGQGKIPVFVTLH